jgi:hypothetical protein
LLPYNLNRILVLPDPKKNWLPETVIPRRLREFDLADQHRLDPMATLHFGSAQSLVPAVAASRREIKKGDFSFIDANSALPEFLGKPLLIRGDRQKEIPQEDLKVSTTQLWRFS